MKVVILENIRSAYNVGNIIRTADALGWDVWITGYTPSPFTINKVVKTSLGAENNVNLRQFGFTKEAIEAAQKLSLVVLASELSDSSIKLDDYSKKCNQDVAVVFGNEVEGVLDETLRLVDEVVYIPMSGLKESLNVGQSAAIVMRELGKVKL